MTSGISLASAKRIFREMMNGDESAEQIAERLDLWLPTGEELRQGALAAICENPKVVNDYWNGNASAVNRLVGAVMSQTRGRAAGGEARAAVMRELIAGAP